MMKHPTVVVASLVVLATTSVWGADKVYTDSPTGSDAVTIVNDDANSTTTWRPASVDGWTGSLILSSGSLKFDAQSKLGTGTVYNNNESGSARRLEFAAASGTTLTIANKIVLGTENQASWQDRIRITGGGMVKFTGPITVNASKMFVLNSSTCYVQGGVTGQKAIFAPSAGGAVYIDTKPVTVTGSFWMRDASVYLNVAGSSFPAYYGGGNGKLVLGGTDFFPSGANFASQNDTVSSATLDVNGFDQHLGGHFGEGAAKRPFTLVNSKTQTQPTVTISQTAGDNLGKTLVLSGTMNVVKDGAKTLSVKTGVYGDLTVKAGMFLLGPDISNLANAVTLEGGILDLGGCSVLCETLVVKAGAAVQNGTITARQTTIDPGAILNATVVGPISTSGSGRFVVTKDFALQPFETRTYQIPAEAAVYYPFDGSLAEALRDQTGGGADLSIYAGAPVYVDKGRNGGGCLYFNGSTQLRTTTFPANVPTDGNDVTCAAWIKVDSGCSTRGGWLSYGDTAKGKGSSLCFSDSFKYIKWYANDVDSIGTASAALDDGAWHYIVGTQNGSTRKIYVDGVLINTADQKPLNVVGTLFIIGKTMWDDAFKGWIDDVLVMNRALTASEVANLYASGGVPTTINPQKKTLNVTAGTVVVPGPGVGVTPVVAYSFDSAATLNQDSSGNNYTLKTLNGTPSFAAGVSPVSTSAGSLRVQNVRMTVDGDFPAKLPVGNASHTVCTYIKAQSVAQATGWFGYGANATRQGNNLGYNWSNPPGICSSWYGSDWAGSADSASWHSVVSTYDQTTSVRTFYIDGRLVKSATDTSNFAATNFYLGCNVADYNRMFNGWLDEVAVYDTALTAEQVATYHAKGLASGSLSDDSVVKIASGATLDFNGATTSQTLAGLSGAGTVSGSVTLADGAVAEATADGAVTISGSLTFAGGGTVVLPETISTTLVSYPLFTAANYVGTDNLSSWQFVNVPKGKKASLRVRNGTVEALVCASGVTIIIR